MKFFLKTGSQELILIAVCGITQLLARPLQCGCLSFLQSVATLYIKSDLVIFLILIRQQNHFLKVFILLLFVFTTLAFDKFIYLPWT